MKVWVIMGNDFPDAVISTEEGAEEYVKDKKVLEIERRKRDNGSPIHWRYYAFELQDR